MIDAGRSAAALRDAISDPTLRALPPVGGIVQYVDNTDLLWTPALRRAVAAAVLSGVVRGRGHGPVVDGLPSAT